jgi:hypothetical protein
MYAYTNLGFLVPRQQLSIYKQEHQRSKSIATNGPRMDAYIKFMDTMAMSPIDVQYATYKIVPQLETIQLYSSPEVKIIAKNIHDWAKSELERSGKIPHLPNFVGRIKDELKPIIKKELEDLQAI